ncbi:MAG TPA: hypothetical protein VFN11_14170 [Ktedonobacterales bacterium]|nr:hypothetical protein [Ktedonobacterales bacterium]
MNDTYVCAQCLNLDNHLYQIGDEISASAFRAETLRPETPEACIQRLRDAGVLKLPVELQQADDLQAQLAQKQAELEAMQAELAALQTAATTLPASALQRKGATSKGADVAPAAESAPLSE